WGATQSIPSNAMTTPFFIMRPAGVGSMGPDVTARSCRPQDAKAWRAHPAGPTLPHGFARFETAERCRDRPAARRRHRHRLEPLRHRARRRPRAVRRVRPGAAMAGAPHAGAARRPARRRARPFPYSRARGLVRGARGRAGAADRRQRGAQPDPRPLGPAPDRRRGPGPAHRRPGRAGGVVDRHHAVFWSVVTKVFAILPVVGSGLVWRPGAIALLLDHRPGAALLLALICIVVVGNVDYVIRPMVFRRWAHIHPLVTLVGAL